MILHNHFRNFSKLYIILAGLVLTAILLFFAISNIYEQEQRKLHIEGDAIANNIRSALLTCVTGLNNLALLFQSTENVKEDEFEVFSNAIIKRHPWIISASYLPLIEASYKQSFETELQKRGYSGFQIRQFENHSAKEFIFPLRYIAPFTVRNSKLLGFDFYSYSQLQESIQHAIEDGHPTFFANNTPLGQPILIQAIYSGRYRPESVEKRQERVNGLIIFALDFEKLIMGEIPVGLTEDLIWNNEKQNKSQWVRVHRFQNKDSTQEGILKLEHPVDLFLPELKFELQIHKDIAFNQLDWEVVLLTLLTGLMITLSILFILQASQRRNEDLRNQNLKIESEVAYQTAMLKQVLATIPGRIFWKDLHLNYLGCNNRFLSDTGFDDINDVIGKDDYQMNWKKNAADYRRDDREVIETQQSKLDYEELQTQTDGTFRWLRTSKIPLTNATEEVVGVLGVYNDITAEKEAQLRLQQAYEELQETNARLEEAQEIAHLGYWRWKKNSPEIECSKQIDCILGRINKGLKNCKVEHFFKKIIHPQDKFRFKKVLLKILKNQQTKASLEYKIIKPDGSIGHVQQNIRAVAENNQIVSIVGTMLDISERVKTQEDLELYRLMVEKTSDAMFLIDIEDNFRMAFVNEAAIKHYGASREEILTWHLPDWDPNFKEKDLPNYIEELKKQQTTGIVIESEHKVKEGQLVPVELSLNLIRYKGRLCHFGYIKNISERRETEQKLLLAKEQAETTAKLKSEFLANMSHEIRTPMNAVINFCYLALQTDLTPKQQDYLEKIELATNSLLGVINDILDFSKIESGHLQIEKHFFDLDETFTQLANMLNMKATSKHLEVLFHYQANLPRFFCGDSLRIYQVLLNLCSNAIKFTEKGEIIVSVKLLEKIDAQHVVLRFSVKDTGIGMSEKQQQNLFKAFSQADASTTRKYGGTGLGLSICKRLVELMNGDITVTSKLGKGSCFSFSLPLELAEKPDILRYSQNDFSQLRILIIDNSQTARDALKSILQSLAIQTECVESGQQALNLLIESYQHGIKYDAVLLDLKMPDLDGLETAKLMQTSLRAAYLPEIVIVTAYDNEAIRPELDKQNIKYLLNKPVSRSTLFDILVKINDMEHQTEVVSKKLLSHNTDFSACDVKILLVEDNEMNQQIVCELLNQWGISHVDIANNGSEALQAVQLHDYQLIFMDIQMPIMDGFKATEKIRQELQKKTPIIAMTAHAMREEVEKCLAYGMNAHLSKPINPEKLLDIIQAWLHASIKIAKKESAEFENPLIQTLDKFADKELLDTRKGLAYAGNNETLYQSLLKQFYEKHTKTIEEMTTYLNYQEFETLQLIAHSLKGISATIGSESVSLAAAEIEDTLKQQKHQDLTKLLDVLAQNLQTLLQLLEKALDFEMPAVIEKKQEIFDRDSVVKLLQQFMQYLEDDLVEAKQLFPKLESYLLNQEDFKQLFLDLDKSLKEYDTDLAAEITTSLLQKLETI